MTYSEYEQIFKKQNYETKPRVICSQKEQKKKQEQQQLKDPKQLKTMPMMYWKPSITVPNPMEYVHSQS